MSFAFPETPRETCVLGVRVHVRINRSTRKGAGAVQGLGCVPARSRVRRERARARETHQREMVVTSLKRRRTTQGPYSRHSYGPMVVVVWGKRGTVCGGFRVLGEGSSKHGLRVGIEGFLQDSGAEARRVLRGWGPGCRIACFGCREMLAAGGKRPTWLPWPRRSP